MVSRFDLRTALRALGPAANNADLELVRCKACARQYLVDHEHLRIYTNPEDLSMYFLNIEGYDKPCIGCHRDDWDFEAADEIASEWQGLVRPLTDEPAS